MTTGPIRLSPSGPIVDNDAGAPFAPGPGARLRLTEATSTSVSTNVIPTVPAELNSTIGVPGFELLFANANADLQYRATVLCDVTNPTTNQSHSIELYLDSGPTNVGPWTEVAKNQHTLAAATSRQIRLDMPIKSGHANGMANGQTTLWIRARIGASSGGAVSLVSGGNAVSAGATNQGAILLQAEEML